MIVFKSFQNTKNLNSEVVNILQKYLSQPTSIMLSGGSTPYKAYNQLAMLPINIHKDCRLFLSDERYVPITSEQNNTKHLLSSLEKLNCKNQFIQIDTSLKLQEAVCRYDNELQDIKHPSLGLLGIGADGHTAGLFSTDNDFLNSCKFSIDCLRPDGMHGISVTKKFIHTVKKIIILASGESKKPILMDLKNNPSSIIAGLVLNNHPNTEVWTDISI